MLKKLVSSPTKNLEFSELRYRRLFETAQDGILILDAVSGEIVDVNPFLQEFLGYSEAELLGKELWEIGVFKDIVDSKAAFLELQAKGYIRYKDLPLQTKHGNSVDVEFVSNVYLVGDESVIQCNIRDITDRRIAEKKLETNNAELEDSRKAMLNIMEELEAARAVIELEKAKDEAMLASIGEGLIAIDNERKIIVINKAAEDMLGWKMKDILGEKITSFRLEDEDGNLVSPDKRPTAIALSTGETASNTFYFVKKDQTRLPLAITVTPIKMGNKIIGALDIFRDITREKEIDQQKSEFVSLASHQLRTPLGIIKWYLEALENEDYFHHAPAEIQNYFDEVYKNNERVLALVRDLLSVSRIDQGHVKNSPKPSDLTQILKDIVAQLQIVAHKKHVQLHLIIQNSEIPDINIDSLRFHEVIENLISNAIDYTLETGKVDVTIDQQEDVIVISIKDTGIGISVEDQKSIFTKFFRGENAVAYNPEGSGLGLYVVKAYVEGWKGKISVESDSGGSIFTVSLPAVQRG